MIINNKKYVIFNTEDLIFIKKNCYMKECNFVTDYKSVATIEEATMFESLNIALDFMEKMDTETLSKFKVCMVDISYNISFAQLK